MIKILRNLGLILAIVSLNVKAFSQSYEGTQTVNVGQNMTVSLYIDPVADTVQITMTGPVNVWKGFGFGANAMSSTYAIITDGNGNIQEREMGNHTSGTVLTSSLISSSYSVSGSTTTTVVTRSLTGLTSSHYTFTAGPITIPIIWAFGSGTSLAYHGTGRGPSTITLTQDCSLTNTAATIDTAVCDIYISPSNTQVWTTSGTFTDIIPNTAGCDSVLTINLTVNNNDTSFQALVCDEYISPSGNYVWTETGVYMDTVTNVAGCDSVITVDLKVNNTDTIITVETCDGFYVSPSGNYTWTSAGTYLDTIPNSLSCDSIITVNVMFPQFFTHTINPIACGSYTSPSGNHTWTSSGTYFDTIPNGSGCDTVFTVNLTIAFLNTAVTQDDHILSADFILGDTYQWVDCANGYAVIPEADDSLYTATENGEYAVIITFDGCVDTSDCFTVNTIGLGFDDINQTQITYFPNPTDGQVTVQFGTVHEQVELRVVNVYGQIVGQADFINTDQAVIDIANESGLYFIEVIHEGDLIEVLKVVKH